MKRFIQFALAGVVVVAMNGCGDNDNDGGNDENISSVTFADLNATGSNGYVINVDIDLSDNEFDSNGTNYYFCTNGGGMPDLDYYAYTNGNTDTPIADEPDYDYGYLDFDEGVLLFTSEVGIGGYSVFSVSNTFQEGQDYNIDHSELPEVNDGTIHINSIDDFNCTIEVAPSSEPILDLELDLEL